MASRRRSDKPEGTPRRPATTPESREDELILLAQDLAEEQLRNGTASSQVISTYAKLGSSRERLEQERMRFEVELLRVKREALEAQAAREDVYREALTAFSTYAGRDPEPEEDYED